MEQNHALLQMQGAQQGAGALHYMSHEPLQVADLTEPSDS